MLEKFEVSKTSLTKGKIIFSLIYQGQPDKGIYAASFFIKNTLLGETYEFSSDFFTANNIYDALLKACTEGKKVLQKNKFDTDMANESFAIYRDKIQNKFNFGETVWVQIILRGLTV